MKKYSWLLLSFVFATSAAVAADHEKEPDPAGGSIFFQTDDPAAYLALLKSDDKLFKATEKMISEPSDNNMNEIEGVIKEIEDKADAPGTVLT